MKNNQIMDISMIMEMLPHRDPFLFIDRVVDFESNKTIIAEKDLVPDMVFFSGHFPGRPTAPYMFSNHGIITFRALVDNSSMELFVDNARMVMTELFFPEEPFNSLSLYSTGWGIELMDGSISSVAPCW